MGALLQPWVCMAEALGQVQGCLRVLEPTTGAAVPQHCGIARVPLTAGCEVLGQVAQSPGGFSSPGGV